MRKISQKRYWLFVFLLNVYLSGSVLAGNLENVGIRLTDVEMQAGMQLLPPEIQEKIKSSEFSARNFMTDLLTRRAITLQAQQQGLMQDEEVVARLRLIQDKVIQDIYLERAVAHKIDEKRLIHLAEEEYRAFPERYKVGEEVWARHILIAACQCAPGGDTGRIRAEEILTRLKAGESFEELAQAESADPGTAARGGDLGFFSRGKMVKSFEDAAFALQKQGELSDIVKSDFGYHIIRLEGRREGRQRPFEEVRDDLIAKARQKLQENLRADMIRSAREGLNIDENLQVFRKLIDAVPEQ